MSSISATIAGAARLAPTGSAEEKFYCDQHLENHTFDEGTPLFRQESNTDDNGRTSHFVAGEEVGVIVVDIRQVRISDWKGNVRDWDLVSTSSMVNGVH